MLRDAVFRSGAPALIASVCLLAMAYLATVHRERLAGYWTVAWALLLARYGWNAYFTPFAETWILFVALVLRVGFSATVLAGAFALRGERLSSKVIVAFAVGVPLAGLGIAQVMGTPGVLPLISTGVMLVMLVLAAWRLATATALPTIERIGTAVALAAYAVVSTILPRLQDGTSTFQVATLAAWAAQLVTSFGLLATFLRISHDREVSSHRTMETRLTDALGGFVQLCMHCKAVRDDRLQWQPLERFVARRTSSQLSHGICHDCAKEHYPEDWDDMQPQSA
jgi:hypothetical protein